MKEYYHLSNKLNKEVGDLFITASPNKQKIIDNVKGLNIQNEKLQQIIDDVLAENSSSLVDIEFKDFYEHIGWQKVNDSINKQDLYSKRYYAILIDELFLEFLRLKFFPELPSRLLCIFLHENIDDIQQWWDKGGLDTKSNEEGIDIFVYTLIPREIVATKLTYEAHRNQDQDYILHNYNLLEATFDTANDRQHIENSRMNYWYGYEPKGNTWRRLPETLFIGTLEIIKKQKLADIIVLSSPEEDSIMEALSDLHHREDT